MKFIIKQVSMSYEAFVYVTEFIFNHKQVATTELVQELVYEFNQLQQCGVYMKDLPKTEVCEMDTFSSYEVSPEEQDRLDDISENDCEECSIKLTVGEAECGVVCTNCYFELMEDEL